MWRWERPTKSKLCLPHTHAYTNTRAGCITGCTSRVWWQPPNNREQSSLAICLSHNEGGTAEELVTTNTCKHTHRHTEKKIIPKIKTWATQTHTQRHTHTYKRGNSERCHLCEERSVFQTVSGSEFAFSVECKSGWIKQHLASADGLSLCICVYICVCICLYCDDARRRLDLMQANLQTVPFSCQDPSLSFLSFKVSFHCFLAHHLSLFLLLCVAHRLVSSATLLLVLAYNFIFPHNK